MLHYAIGDIHGCYDQLIEMYSNIMNDFLEYKKEHEIETKPTIVCLGDYIDRGSYSYEVIEFLIDRQNNDKVFSWIFLKGNHEDMLLEDQSNWMLNGGRETVNSYIKNDLDSQNFIDYNNIFKLIGHKHLKFFKNLKLFYKVGGVVFVHAGINPLYNDIEQNSESIFLWAREWAEYKGPYNCTKLVVHGHTPYLLEKNNYLFSQSENRINIDTACVYGGHLSAIRINDVFNEPTKINVKFVVPGYKKSFIKNDTIK